MARFAPVGPAQLLADIRQKYGDHTLGFYHLLLAHDIIEDRRQWVGVLPPRSTIIVDNSVIELGESVALESVLKAYEDLLHVYGTGLYKYVLVLPEKLDDPVMTHYMALEALQQHNSPLFDADIMYVIQGLTLADLNKAFLMAREAIELGATWIAIPRRITEGMGTRYYALAKALQLKLEIPGIKIHLFGFSDLIQDDILCCQSPLIEGIDSAVPLRLGQMGKPIDITYVGDQAGPRQDYWENPGEVTDLTRHNLDLIKSVCRTHPLSLSEYTPILTGREGNRQ